MRDGMSIKYWWLNYYRQFFSWCLRQLGFLFFSTFSVFNFARFAGFFCGGGVSLRLSNETRQVNGSWQVRDRTPGYFIECNDWGHLFQPVHSWWILWLGEVCQVIFLKKHTYHKATQPGSKPGRPSVLEPKVRLMTARRFPCTCDGTQFLWIIFFITLFRFWFYSRDSIYVWLRNA
jgi:hypothetical protein